MNITWKFRIVGIPGVVFLAFGAVAAAQGLASVNADTQGQVVFAKDVAPILQRSCQVCHRPGSVAPMSLLTYEDVRPWAKSIKQRVANHEMPPWFIDRNIGVRQFKDDPSLTDKEIATIVKWVDGGTIRGNPADMPAARKFDDLDKWHIGKPDLIVTMPEAHTVPANGPDWWGDYFAETGLTEDRYIKAVETKPSSAGFRVVHHLGTSMIQEPDDDGIDRGVDADDLGRPFGTRLGEYAVGKNADFFPEGSGLLMKAGAKIRFNLHYHSVGEEVKDRPQVAVVFYPKGYVPKYPQIATSIGMAQLDDLDIPAGASNVRHDGYFRLAKPTRLTAFQPHMHNRGKAMCMEAIYLDGTTEMLSCVDRFNFGWHIVYNYADDVAPLLPAGTMLHATGWHDNSAANKNNPDPRNTIGFGQRTIDDMMLAHVNLTYLSDEDFKRQVEERKAKQGKATHQQ